MNLVVLQENVVNSSQFSVIDKHRLRIVSNTNSREKNVISDRSIKIYTKEKLSIQYADGYNVDGIY